VAEVITLGIQAANWDANDVSVPGPGGRGQGVTMKNVMLVLILIACVASGCNNQKVAGSKGDTATSSDPKTAVIDASRKFIALQSLTGKIEAVAETPFKQQVQYVAPDRYHVVYRDDAGAELEMIMAGNNSYLRSGDSWNEVPGDTNPSPTLRNSFTEEALKSISDVKFEGEETVDGKPALVYSYKLLTVVGNFPVTQKIWVSKSSGIPIKCFVEYSSGQIKTLTTTFDTESPVTINLPVK
jgi:outer membrane lipoprotein-sorting protein